ncbi:MAG TPA: HNH endonuclease [Methylomirabilota bacterium]|nr:HNH endonuclease [Methylomirabilota bacterium]
MKKGTSRKEPKSHHNYVKETSYEDRPEQVERREARNVARRKAERRGTVHKGDRKEVDHTGSHRTGSLRHVKTRVVSRTANRRRQPKRH